MSKYENLLILHLLGVFMLVGGHTLSVGSFLALTRIRRTRQVLLVAGIAKRADQFLIVPGTIGLIGFGLWLVDEAGFGFGEAWLIASYVLAFVAVLVGAAVLGPAAQRMGIRAAQLLGEGVEESDEPRSVAIAPRLQFFVHLETALLLAFIYLMVAKPGA